MSLQEQFLLIILVQVVTIGTLLITNYLNKRHANKLLEGKIQIEKKIEYLEKQLTEFYSPIYSLLKINRQIIETRWDPERRERRIETSEEVWKDLRDNVLIPNNRKIVEIIEKNIHLINNVDVPHLFMAFIAHAEIWPRTLKHKDDFKRYLSRFSFPIGFDDAIYTSTERLKKEYYELIRKTQ